MSNINPPDEPGFTQMYSFGVKSTIGDRTEYLVMTVRAITEEQARRHIVAIFRGSYNGASLQFFTDMDLWKQEAKTEANPNTVLTSDEVQALPEPIRTIYSTSSPLIVSNHTRNTLHVLLVKNELPSSQVVPPYMRYAFSQVERVEIIADEYVKPYATITDNEHAQATYSVSPAYEITDRTPDEVRLWWDRGILWINVAEGTLAVNGLEARALLKKLQDEQVQIEAQISIDEKVSDD